MKLNSIEKKLKLSGQVWLILDMIKELTDLQISYQEAIEGHIEEAREADFREGQDLTDLIPETEIEFETILILCNYHN